MEKIALVFVIAGILLFGCTGGAPEPTIQPTVEASSTPTATPTEQLEDISPSPTTQAEAQLAELEGDLENLDKEVEELGESISALDALIVADDLG